MPIEEHYTKHRALLSTAPCDYTQEVILPGSLPQHENQRKGWLVCNFLDSVSHALNVNGKTTEYH